MRPIRAVWVAAENAVVFGNGDGRFEFGSKVAHVAESGVQHRRPGQVTPGGTNHHSSELRPGNAPKRTEGAIGAAADDSLANRLLHVVVGVFAGPRNVGKASTPSVLILRGVKAYRSHNYLRELGSQNMVV